MYCGLGAEGTFRIVVGEMVSIDDSLAHAIPKYCFGNLQKATCILNAGWDVC